MVNQYKICYTAQWPDGKLLDPKNPCLNAYVEASNETEAMSILINELRGLKVKILEKPQTMNIADDI